MMTFLKTVLIILLVYFGLKFLIKLLTPYIMKWVSKKMAQKFESAFGHNPMNPNPPQKEGNITIDKMPKNEGATHSKVGEYVDYEEVE